MIILFGFDMKMKGKVNLPTANPTISIKEVYKSMKPTFLTKTTISKMSNVLYFIKHAASRITILNIIELHQLCDTTYSSHLVYIQQILKSI